MSVEVSADRMKSWPLLIFASDTGLIEARAHSLNFCKSSSQVIGRSGVPGTLEPSRSKPPAERLSIPVARSIS